MLLRGLRLNGFTLCPIRWRPASGKGRSAIELEVARHLHKLGEGMCDMRHSYLLFFVCAEIERAVAVHDAKPFSAGDVGVNMPADPSDRVPIEHERDSVTLP